MSTIKTLFFPLAVIYGVMFTFTFMTPFAADDYGYFVEINGQISNAFPAAAAMYTNWGGRMVAHLIAFVFVVYPTLHLVLTPLVFTGNVYLIAKVALGKHFHACATPIVFFSIFLCLWACVPSFGAVFFWLVGAAYYCWPLFFILFFLVLYRNLLDFPEHKLALVHIPLFLIAGFLAGASNENTGIIAFLLSLLVLVYTYQKKHHVSLVYSLGCLACLAGWLILILAPGNYARMLSPGFEPYHALTFSQKTIAYISRSLRFQLYLLPMYVLAYLFLKIQKTKNLQTYISFIFFGASFLGLGAFFFSVPPAHRAYTSIAVFAIIGLVALVPCIQHYQFTYKKGVLIAVSLLFTAHIALQLFYFYENNAVEHERLTLLQSAESNVLLPPYKNSGRYFFVGREIMDVQEDPSNWVNSGVANYFSKKTVRLDYTPEKDMLTRFSSPNLAITLSITPDAIYISTPIDLEKSLLYYEFNNTNTRGMFQTVLRACVPDKYLTTLAPFWVRIFYKRSVIQKIGDQQYRALTPNRAKHSAFFMKNPHASEPVDFERIQLSQL